MFADYMPIEGGQMCWLEAKIHMEKVRSKQNHVLSM
jgi:hypothetical protein